MGRWKVRAFPVALALLICAAASAQDAEKAFEPGKGRILSWVEYDEAVSQAKTHYKPIMIYFYSKKCLETCMELETKYFKQSTVKSMAKKFAATRVCSDDNEELRKKWRVSGGGFALVFVNFRLDELARIEAKDSFKKLTSVMKDAYKENDKLADMEKSLERAFKKAMRCKKSKNIAKCIKYLEALAEKRGEVESSYIEKAENELAEIEKRAKEHLKKAEDLITKARRSLSDARRMGSGAFRMDQLMEGQKILAAVKKNYPLKSLAERIEADQKEIIHIQSEYARIVEEENKKNRGKR